MIPTRARASQLIPLGVPGVNRIESSRDLTVYGGYCTKAYDQVGIEGIANTASLITDDSVTSAPAISFTTLSRGTSDTLRLWIKKETVAGWSLRIWRRYGGGGTYQNAFTMFDPYTGEIYHSLSGINSQGLSVTLRDGWWVIIENTSPQNEEHTDIWLVIYPTIAQTPTSPVDAALTGSIIIGQVELYDNVPVSRLWNAPPVYTP